MGSNQCSLVLDARSCLEQHVIDCVPPCLPIKDIGVAPELHAFGKRLHVARYGVGGSPSGFPVTLPG